MKVTSRPLACAFGLAGALFSSTLGASLTFVLYVSPASGVAPLRVTFSLVTEFVPAAVTLDVEGDGDIDFTGRSVEGQSFTYRAPGRYHPSATATDGGGRQYKASALVLVEDRDTLDALLQGKWTGMKRALQERNIPGALQFIVPESRSSYEQMFIKLSSTLAKVGAELGEIRFIEVRENVAEYELLADEGGKRLSYYVQFRRDEDGQWYLKSF